MKKLFIFISVILFSSITQAGFFNKCSDYGCLIINGKKLSFDEAEQLVYHCDTFTNRGMGRIALQSSYSEIAKRTGNDVNSPLMMAYLAYSDLYDSPLSFKRAKSAKDVNYSEIVRSCNQLKNNFNSNRNWVR